MKTVATLICAIMILGFAPAGRLDAATMATKAVAILSEIGNSAQTEVVLPKEPSGTPKFVHDAKSAEQLVWDSGIEDDKPLDVDKAYLSHDAQYINVRIVLGKSLGEVSGDPFISIAFDTDLNPSTGMPKLRPNSYNMGGEDFFARFSTGYGAQYFVIDRWDQATNDTVETGGLANTSASGKEIKFSIPRIAICDPAVLDFKIVGRTYQSVDPDLSPEHLTYQMYGTEKVEGWKVEKTNPKTFSISTPAIQKASIEHVNIVWDNIVVPITRYSVNPPTNPDAVIWSNQPQVGKHLFMTRVEVFEDDENLKFKLDFADSLKGMGSCDFKIWAMLDTDGRPNVGFEGQKFADNYDDYIMEVATEIGAVRSKLYTASKGMGYNQPSLNLGTLDPKTGICEMTVKKTRIGEPTKIKARFACGAYKAIEADWDSTPKIELPGKLMYLQYKTLYTEQARGFPLDITKVEAVTDTAYLYLRITVKNLDKGKITVWVDQDANPLTGIPASPSNPAGIDNTIELTSTLGTVLRFNPDGSKTKVGDFLGIRYQDGRLHFPVPLKLLSNPKTIRFHVSSSDNLASTAHTLWCLQIGETTQLPCSSKPKTKVESVNGVARLSWETSASDDIGYYIYRRSTGDTFDRITNTPVTGKTFDDPTVEWNKYYQYKVMAMCSDGGKSDMSDPEGVYIKQDKPQAKIQLDKSVIDFGQRAVTRNVCEGFTIKNLGPGAVEFRIATTDEGLSATAESLKIEEGQSKRVNVCITTNLPVGKWENFVVIDTGDIKVQLPVKVEVTPSRAADKIVEIFKATPLVSGIKLEWETPKYNQEKVSSYTLVITEFYMGTKMASQKITLDANSQNLTLEKLDFETLYRFTITPVYPSGNGLETDVEAMPLSPKMYIILKIGSKEAIVSGKPASISAIPYIDSKAGKTMVPFRFIAESLGCTVSYDSPTKTITMKRGWKTVKLTVGSTQATVGPITVNISPAPVIKSGSTFVPVRFVADAFNAETTWNATTKQVGIYFPLGYRP